MASEDMSRRASVASSSEMSLVDPAAAAKILPKKDKASGTIKLKKAIAKQTKSRESGSKNATRSPSPTSPSINGNDAEARASVAASQSGVGEENALTVRCKHCKEPLPKTQMASHIKTCPEKKKVPKKKDPKETTQKPKKINGDKDTGTPVDDSIAVKAGPDEAGTDGLTSTKGVNKSAKTSAAKASTATNETSKKTKKRKAEGEEDKMPKKKKLKKDEPPKAKLPKPKGPVDVEKQCGVLLQNGAHCARSLTCKSHSMGAKRSVPGRSMPYDYLLAQYQKKNQAKQQKAAMDANAPLADDFETAGPVDSDEEKDQIMAAIARSRPQPLAQHIPISTRSKYQRIRIKDALANAMNGNRGGGNLFAIRPPEPANAITDGGNVVASPVGVGPSQGDGGTGGEGSRRPSLIQQAVGGAAQNRAGVTAAAVGTGGPAQRKTSVA